MCLLLYSFWYNIACVASTCPLIYHLRNLVLSENYTLNAGIDFQLFGWYTINSCIFYMTEYMSVDKVCKPSEGFLAPQTRAAGSVLQPENKTLLSHNIMQNGKMQVIKFSSLIFHKN